MFDLLCSERSASRFVPYGVEVAVRVSRVHHSVRTAEAERRLRSSDAFEQKCVTQAIFTPA